MPLFIASINQDCTATRGSTGIYIPPAIPNQVATGKADFILQRGSDQESRQGLPAKTSITVIVIADKEVIQGQPLR